MTGYVTPQDLSLAFQQRCESMRRPKFSVLLRRGDNAFGTFLILAGTVYLDFGVDGSNPLNKAYGPGALIGLPATLTGRPYSMTATVTADAELGFLSIRELKSLLREQPELQLQLLDILGAKIAQVNQAKKAMLTKEDKAGGDVGLA
jgi:CRP-like cAMP-binding protein